MRVTTRIVWDVNGNLLEHEWYDYSGPVELCDRAAQQAARGATRFAEDVSEQERQNRNTERTMLTPFYRQELNAQHAFTPGQTNELLNFAGATAAGGGATTAGEASATAARTRNTSGFTPALDQAARDRQKLLSGTALGIGAQDITGAKEMNREGAAGLAGLYGVDTSGMLGAMGRKNEAINAQIAAASSRGWMQQLQDALKMAKSVGGKFMPGGDNG